MFCICIVLYTISGDLSSMILKDIERGSMMDPLLTLHFNTRARACAKKKSRKFCTNSQISIHAHVRARRYPQPMSCESICRFNTRARGCAKLLIPHIEESARCFNTRARACAKFRLTTHIEAPHSFQYTRTWVREGKRNTLSGDCCGISIREHVHAQKSSDRCR